ncbi:MAG: phosphate ABC transporter substrate-binding protein PstS [Micrococcaceae bacterium]
MKLLRSPKKSLATVFLASVFVLSACNPDDNVNTPTHTSSLKGTLTGIGSSAQKSAVDAWTAEFESNNSQVNLQYSSDGSGAGRTALINKSADFAGSDVAMKPQELEQSKNVCGSNGAFDIPVYISPIEITFNLENIKELNLDSATIAKIFNGKITKWNDTAIAALNPGVKLPDLAITPVHRGDESGTTQNFTDYLHKTAGSEWPDEGAQSWPKAYDGEAAQKTAGVVSTTQATPGAIAYADESGVSPDLGKVKIKVGNQFVAITPEGASKVVAQSPKQSGRAANDLAIDINRTSTDPTTYPLVLVSYHVLCSTYPSQEKADNVKAWESYVVSEQGQNTSKQSAGSAPLPDTLRAQAQQSINSIGVQ